MIEVAKVTNTVNRMDFLSIGYMRNVGLTHLKQELKELVMCMGDNDRHDWEFIRCSAMLDVLGTLQIIPVDYYSTLHDLIVDLYSYDVNISRVYKVIDELIERN